MTKKKIDLGEYVITIYHNEIEEILEVTVFDELGEAIESIVITSDEDEDDEIQKNEGPDNFNYNLN